MSGKVWVYSDPHFFHNNIVKFEQSPGVKLRPWDCAEKMTEDMIDWYNEMVDDGDRVYILGDVAFSPQLLIRAVSRLKGRKVLVPGNHDPKRMSKWIHLFDDVRGYVQRGGFIMSHIPLHPGSLGRWKLNIHGHTHANVVEWPAVNPRVMSSVPDERYFCACVEQTNFRPILLDDILKQKGLLT